MPDIDSETARLAGVENVPLVPSGNDSVCMSTEDTAVVALDCKAGRLSVGVAGRFEVCRREGLGGSGGRCSSSPRGEEGSTSPSRVIGASVPSSAFACPDGRVGVSIGS